MKLSKRGKYAPQALIDLGIASELGLRHAAGERAGRKRKTACETLKQTFIQLKAADYASPSDCRENALNSTCTVDFHPNIILNK